MPKTMNWYAENLKLKVLICHVGKNIYSVAFFCKFKEKIAAFFSFHICGGGFFTLVLLIDFQIYHFKIFLQTR